MADSKRRELSVDEALNVVGEFGLAQKLQTLVGALGWGITSFTTLLVLFSGLGIDPQRSKLIECSKTNTEGLDACEAALTQPYPAICAHSWTWKAPGLSLVTEFNLTCGKEWLVYAAAGCFFLGTLLGCAIWHAMFEKIPPRRMLHTSAIIAGVAGCLAATAPFLWTFMIFRVLSGVGVAGMGMAAFILSSDLMGPSWRPFAGLFLHGGFSAGAVIGTFVAWAVPYWRWITLFAALLPLVMTITTWSILVESPQWLLLRGRKGEATAALAAVAFTNKTRPPEHSLADPTSLLSNPHRTILDILKNVRLRRQSFLLGLVWFAVTASYYAGILLADSLSSGNSNGDGSALQLAITGFMYELPGIAAAGLVAERLGRKWATIGGLLQGGGCLLAAGLAWGDAQRALAVGARFGLAAACSALYILSWESFPVVVQHPGMALLNYATRLGALASPALALAAVRLHSGLVTLAVTGAVCLGAATLVTLVPETLGSPAFETIQELNSAAAKRHRSWTYSLRSVFRPLPQAGATPAGAMVYPLRDSSV